MKKINFIAALVFLFVIDLSAQQNTYSTFYYQRASIFEKLPVHSSDIVFLGNSITNFGEWGEFFKSNHIKNRGISGDRTDGVFARLNTILPGKPKKIFLMIGVNDLEHGVSPDSVLYGIIRIANRIATESPKTRLFIQSILPVNDQFGKFPKHTNKGAAIIQINSKLRLFCQSHKITFIDLYSSFKNENDEKLNPKYTNDGLHLMGEGYLLWIKLIANYVGGGIKSVKGVSVHASEKLISAKIGNLQPQIPVLTLKPENEILQIGLQVNSASAFTIEKIKINLQGTTDLSDIESIKLSYIGNTSKSKVNRQFGKVFTPKANIVFNDRLVINDQTAFFCVLVQLKKNIDLLHRVNASCEYIETDAGIVKSEERTSDKGLRVGVALRQHGDNQVDTYRIPGLTTTKNGTLLATYDVRRQKGCDLQGDIDICLSRSIDGGTSWEPMRIGLDRGNWGGLPQKYNGISDACVLVNEQNNDIFIAGLWMHGILDKNGKWVEGLTENSTDWEHQWRGKGSQPGFDEKQTCQFLITKSTDDGRSWSEPQNLTRMCKKEEWWLWAPAPGHGITLSDGTLAFPTQGRGATGSSFSNMTWSKDGGKTWKTSNAASSGTTENMIVQLQDGSIMINMRDGKNKTNRSDSNGRVIAVSSDLGNTWTPHPTSRGGLIEPGCMAGLHKHIYTENGVKKSILLFSNPNSKSGRNHMTIKVSFDDGASWPEKNWILLDEGSSRGYSCLTSVNEQTIGILYEGSQSDMVFQKIALSDIIGNENN